MNKKTKAIYDGLKRRAEQVRDEAEKRPHLSSALQKLAGELDEEADAFLRLKGKRDSERTKKGKRRRGKPEDEK